ncbi:MAG: sodium ion-translocating decarboxylase subunit beta [Candidatus Borkfalkiaceae bacterium]|nr:sodium ion-translocating decarboxylase subunit beta [Christensenellaceae bacterium]
MNILDLIGSIANGTVIAQFFQGDGWMRLVMILIGCVFLFLAIKKDFEPYLLIPIAFGIILVNIFPEIYITYDEHGEIVSRGLLGYLHLGVECELYPCLIFLGIGATTDFGPLIANKKTMLLGAAAQVGIFFAFFGALLLGFDFYQASSIGIIGGADGPTAILVSNKMAAASGNDGLLAGIALAAYSYMALVPVIFPPVIRLFTTKKERLIKMEQLREVSKTEKILFPIIVTIAVCLIVPSATPLIGCLMLGNLIKECGVVPNLLNTVANSLLYICTVLLGLSVGATANGTTFLQLQTLYVFALGIAAFVAAAIGGLLFGKLMCVLSKGKINPMIGAAGVSAVPMAARVVQKEGQREDPSNFLLMHAMGPNVAGVIGSAIAAGILMTIFL